MLSRDDLAAQLEAVVRVHQQLRGARDIGELLSRAVEAACGEAGFDRGVIVSVGDGRLTAAETGALPTAASDRLRRELLAAPVVLEPNTVEHAVVRAAGAGRRGRIPQRSLLAMALGLDHYSYTAIAPEGLTLALLVVDRVSAPADVADQAMLEAVSAITASELARVVQRLRVQELTAELRGFSTTAIALAGEVLDAPAALPRDNGFGPSFPRSDVRPVPAGASVQSLFSPRELRIATLLVEGRSNREIAEVLVVSPETVKTHVARILKKLGASNRVEAVSRYLRLTQSA
jgi:DNA-binding NarL/FixJ family response regulator